MDRAKNRSFFENNGLSVVLLGLFALSMVGQAITGWLENNAEAVTHGEGVLTVGQYLMSGHFWEATGENWESEFLQMAMFVLLTCSLRQKGSAESKRIGVVEAVDLDPRDFQDQPDVPRPVRVGGWRLRLYENSLGLIFAALFVLSFAMHAAGGWRMLNEEETAHGLAQSGLGSYLSSSQFWFESFQNWQSEFLSLSAMVIGTIYFRQRWSAESKAVHASHGDTGR